MDLTIERETAEFIPVPVDRDGQEVSSYEVCVTRWPARPSGWTAAVTVGDETGVAVSGLQPGTYQVWARVAGTVLNAGTLEVR